ncbi:MAG: UDP-N-acetylmuramoyl-L-alanyl-D-glutamate--2,6-diaminopimelate ligase [Candidatus Pacebacteria bacterium]|nr:UDP-N-acetylmuramoyl-L-alanyl-D-glutamate--2,6-diaminopimelate ligase [Candidatus Paceibacterota bacterium]MDD2757119.1 UDP-N-acetylmuramoyl-L-alanyl-D-glutamate--2,6-diaminopimelate ligase [Candidatus Paceibacterota bacterium]MDD3283610.1 UDP-N-acetylmuramoyl-L-alanyl-D-glutamate--2,6-diaminopimelate ligase [Candidatus Paceibacterota bacterium]MDD3969767.1 UDP-N-acetylmuramoyl-L-alanyl-D-glutamate--2,6-diaminopimelate ligase [Candidatus Paceibacterota bacterium]MDD4737637.1 UDP-N-acetylmura
MRKYINIAKKFIPAFLISWYHLALSFMGALYYGFPGKKIKVIGITGTNGKSTVINITSQILKEAGHKVASSSSIIFKIGDIEEENKMKMTMPGRFSLQKFLKKAVSEKCDYVIIEVTSEGIKQHRHRFINFDVVAITNLTPEHIEAHKGFENYKKAKGELFNTCKNIHIINSDDEYRDYFMSFPAKETITYGIKRGDILAEDINLSPRGSTFKVNKETFELKLLCEFNIYNSLAAISIGLSQGISIEICKRGLSRVEQIAGRMEEVVDNIFVDYAFTPNALEKVYNFLKPKDGKLICVLGSCGGGRDKWKRPVLGKIADNYGDVIIITNEDPYDEDPMEIINQVAEGSKRAEKIIDRREAIRRALQLKEDNDVVVITGKGCEPWICVAHGKKIPWDDRSVIRECIDN